MRTPPLSAVLFDLDGTLIDSTGLILAAYRHTMRRHLGHELPDHVWLAGLGKPLDVQHSELARSEEERVAMRATYREFYISHHDAMLAPFAGVVDALATLRGRGLPLAVVTSKMRDTTERALEVCGIAGSFAAVVSVDDVTRAKPDPEPVRVALSRLGAEPGASMFVGDSPFDMAAGRGAGVRRGAATWGPFPREALAEYAPECWLERPADIADLR